jgi:hypothetical protein
LLGGGGVLSTPSMIAFMERASIQVYFARRAHHRRLSTAIVNLATPLGTAGHEHIVAATATIGAFGIRLRQLIGYDRLRSQPA